MFLETLSVATAASAVVDTVAVVTKDPIWVGWVYKAGMTLIALLGFTSVLIKLSKIASDISDIFAVLSKALLDGKLTPEELADVKKEIQDVICDVKEFKK